MLRHEDMIENVHRRIAQYEEEKKMKHSKFKNLISAKHNEDEHTEVVNLTEDVSHSNWIHTVSSVAACAVLVTGIGAAGFLLHKNNTYRYTSPEDEVIFTDAVTATEAAGETDLVFQFADFEQIYFVLTDNSNESKTYSSYTYDKLAGYLNSFDWGEGKEISENELPNTNNKKEDYEINWSEGIFYYNIVILDNGKAYYSAEKCEPGNENYYYPVLNCSVFDIDYDTFDKSVKDILSQDVPDPDNKLTKRDLKQFARGEYVSGALQECKTDDIINLIYESDKEAQVQQDFIKDFTSMLHKVPGYKYDSINKVYDFFDRNYSNNMAYYLDRYYRSGRNTTIWESYFIETNGNVRFSSWECLDDGFVQTGTKDFCIDINEFETKLKEVLSNQTFDVTTTQISTVTTTVKTTESQTAPVTESQTEKITETTEKENENTTVTDSTEEDLFREFYYSDEDWNGHLVPYLVKDENGNEIEYRDIVEYMFHRAASFQFDKVLGPVADEADAIAKGREILLKTQGQAYVDDHERVYLDDGTKIREDGQFYIVKYYEDYDIWFFRVKPYSPGTYPNIYIRGCDGKFLAVGSG